MQPQNLGFYTLSMSSAPPVTATYKVRVFSLGLVVERKTFFSKEEAATWVQARILEGNFDSLTLEEVLTEGPLT